MFYSTGINQYNVSRRLTSDNFYDSLHAEVDAIQKLPINKSKKKIKINVFVYRISRSKNHNLVMAKCCDNCYKTLYKVANEKNYRIKNIYYTNDNGQIDKY